MNWTIYLIECIGMCVLFGLFVITLQLIDPVSFVSDYPPEIQDEYYRSQHKEKTKEKLSKIMIIKKGIALLVFCIVFAWMAHKAGAQSFVEGLLSAYGYILVISLFDVLILDWIIFANVKQIRLPGTEHMDKEYHQKWFHVKVMFPMIPIFLMGGLVIAGCMVVLWT